MAQIGQHRDFNPGESTVAHIGQHRVLNPGESTVAHIGHHRDLNPGSLEWNGNLVLEALRHFA